MSITIKEIAEKANLSIATVSRALNNLDNVK
ncbi:MAG: LacI family DNA-binding transcriptional regulator, partial [Ignavibacteriaceae bacterium]